MSEKDLLLPDIGDFQGVEVIEILVKAGDAVNAEDPLLTLESDKATMDIPAPASGTVAELTVKVGDKVSEGTKLGVLEASGDAAAAAPAAAESAAPEPVAAPAASTASQDADKHCEVAPDMTVDDNGHALRCFHPITKGMAV